MSEIPEMKFSNHPNSVFQLTSSTQFPDFNWFNWSLCTAPKFLSQESGFNLPTKSPGPPRVAASPSFSPKNRMTKAEDGRGSLGTLLRERPWCSTGSSTTWPQWRIAEAFVHCSSSMFKRPVQYVSGFKPEEITFMWTQWFHLTIGYVHPHLND